MIDFRTFKWEDINMYIVVCFLRIRGKIYSIWVIVDKFMKSAHFIPIKSTDMVEEDARFYLNKIVSLTGIPKSIISDRGYTFTSHSWSSFKKVLGTQVKLSTIFHPQMDVQAEHTIKTLEDMLRAGAIDFKGNWESHLLLIE